MDFVMESNGGNSGDEQGETCHSGNGKKEAHRRHASHQIQALEAYFKQCPHPDENQRRHLSKELGLELKQIKFWFQNKRTQAKTQHERFDNTVLRAENERIQCENHAIREALKNVICSSCGGPPLAHPQLNLHNVDLKEKPKMVSTLLTKYTGKDISLDLPFSRDKVSMPVLGVTGIERAAMCETAAAAMDELVRLLSTNEPLWVKSPPDGRYVIHRENYEKAFPRATHLPSFSARIESSKDSALVTMNAGRLVSMFLDADKWVDLFPTIVTEAKTIQVLETGMVENKNGCLQLMYERMHVLSPFVPPREFNFLRHCQEIEAGVWVLVDVSYPSFFKEASSYSWKLPSGCMIQEMPNGRSKITWVEHVVADNETQTHRLFQDLVLGGSAYGSERWLVSLQRMCERYSNAEVTEPVHHIGRADSGEGWKSNIMKLSHRMVKSFCSMLNMSGQLDRSDETNNGVRVSLRHTTETGETKGITVTAATSLWLPVPSQSVLGLLKDHKIRHQWDVLCNGTPITEIANISTGNVPGNCISIIQPFIPSENNMVLLQECLEGMVVYAPISYAAMNTAMNGEDCSDIPILPSGFIVSADSRGSILTLAFQILLSSPSSSPQDLNVQSVATVNNLLTSTLQRLKLLLNCSDLD
ncbi:homeodomain GLABROUS 8 [Hibiscus trionum]|uniref:Homeodomain GLABROUS 8 n=1 Tax=Hibiscus trionum TaxID=183268 RepID=A0A9W7MKA3_HIBTR|nr:homeodomain GLABROUS 8 [Hibiscus trionum]